MASFAAELATLNELLADPKKLKSLSVEIEKAQAIIAKRDEVLAIQRDNQKALDDIAARDALSEKKANESADLFLKAEAAINDALAAKKGADNDAKEAAARLKSAKELEDKNAVIVKKSSAKADLLEKKTAEVDAKTALLDESISRYNDAVSKLSQVKVA